MSVSEHLRLWEKQVERELLGFFVSLGAREVPENWRAEWEEQGRADRAAAGKTEEN